MARIVGIGLVVTVLIGVLRGVHVPIAVQLGIAFTVVVLLLIMQPLREVMAFFADLGRRSGMQGLYLETVLKAVGIAYLAAVGTQMAKDAGEGAVAASVELAGKVLILVVATPVLGAILGTLLQLLP